MIDTKLRKPPLPDNITKILDQDRTPRSIREIQKKFGLAFPFSVMRVVEGEATSVGDIIIVEGFEIMDIRQRADTEVVKDTVIINNGNEYVYPVDYKKYILSV